MSEESELARSSDPALSDEHTFTLSLVSRLRSRSDGAMAAAAAISVNGDRHAGPAFFISSCSSGSATAEQSAEHRERESDISSSLST